MLLFLNYKENFITDFVKVKVDKVGTKSFQARDGHYASMQKLHRPPSIYAKDQSIHESKKKPMFKSLKVYLCTGSEGAIMCYIWLYVE